MLKNKIFKAQLVISDRSHIIGRSPILVMTELTLLALKVPVQTTTGVRLSRFGKIFYITTVLETFMQPGFGSIPLSHKRSVTQIKKILNT